MPTPREQEYLTAEENLRTLADNPYPGRGLVVGLNEAGDMALQAYWVMGRSENSRNRLLVEEDDVVRTVPFDPSKVADPSLIIYNAMRHIGDMYVVSNGDQTDTAIEFLERGESFEAAMQTRTYEPDAPNYTPRITGYIRLSDPRHPGFGISLIRRGSVRDRDERIYGGEMLPATSSERGMGSCVHTYNGDGDPLPSFDVLPYALPMREGVEDTAVDYWENLNPDNRVAIVVKGIHIATRETSYSIINALTS